MARLWMWLLLPLGLAAGSDKARSGSRIGASRSWRSPATPNTFC
jgi:hypothetical protein